MSSRVRRPSCRVPIPANGVARRHGAAVLEAILAIPILLIAIFGMFLFGMILTVQSGVEHAAIEAAREASKAYGATGYDQVDAGQCPPSNPPADPAVDAAVDAVNQVLGVYGLSVGSTGGTSGVQVIVTDQSTKTYRGESIVTDPCAGPFTGCAGKVEVRVVVRYSAIPIPNLLGTFGYSINGQTFHATSVARRCCSTCP